MKNVNPKKVLQQHLQMEDFFTGDFTIRSRSAGQEQQQSKTPTNEDVIIELEKIADEVRKCRKCEIGYSRTNAVPGEGNPNVHIMFIGEGPGADEDAQGRPFVGRAGQLLDKIIAAMGLKRGDVYIGNVLKCRPPENRDPKPEEIINCLPYLQKQIELINPEIIVALGAHAAKALLNNNKSIGQLRGLFHEYYPGLANPLLNLWQPTTPPICCEITPTRTGKGSGKI